MIVNENGWGNKVAPPAPVAPKVKKPAVKKAAPKKVAKKTKE